MNPTAQRSCSRVAAAVGAIVVGSVLGLAAPAQAHNYLVASTPESGEILTELPELFSITTNGSLLELPGNEAAFAIQVSNESGQYFGDGCVTVDGASLYTTPALGEPGAYTMVWQVISEDGHPVSGEIAFEWAPSDASQQSNGTGSPPECGGDPADPADPVGQESSPGDEAEEGASAEGAPVDAAETSDLVWIAGALGAVAITVVATILVVRRRSTDQPETTEKVEKAD